MRRLLPHLAIAVLCFGVGWLVGHTGPGAPGGGFFRLSIDAPTGDTTIKCEGCQFLSWTADGHAGDRQPTLNFTCSDGHCWKVVGAVVVAPQPQLIAQSRSTLVAHP
ncbi:MAG: hypothetical protein ABI634_20165 [Acidobacteriota bacterium]